MANRSRLAEILGLEEDEEYTVKDGDNIVYRIHNGERQYKDALGCWKYVCSENSLTVLINNPSLIIHKPRFSDEEMAFLWLLHKYGNATRIVNGELGTYIFTRNSNTIDYNIGKNLLKYKEAIDLDEMFKEDEDGD